jgi:hypothetical protein
MATDRGYEGSVYYAGNKIAELNHWDITFDPGWQENQAYGDGWQKFGYTLRRASGSISGNSDKTDDTGQNALMEMMVDGGTPSVVWLYLYVSGSAGYYGEAAVTPNRSFDVGDFGKFSASFNSHDKWYSQGVG